MAELKQGIRVMARVTYQQEYSDPNRNYYVFFYRITVENHNPFEVQLLARHWEILDSTGIRTTVDGEGVVGEQPILGPGERFSYESACNLSTGMGRMKGHYVMVRTDSGAQFHAQIPEFKLEVNFALN
ncbi:MAG: Co2+/Mg2+ efflux protein ApaG [Flavobacteriales bacterium]|nr:Co2+/Mg2+ efflux protein ApaG [Flavobacteriales bacterium]